MQREHDKSRNEFFYWNVTETKFICGLKFRSRVSAPSSKY